MKADKDEASEKCLLFFWSLIKDRDLEDSGNGINNFFFFFFFINFINILVPRSFSLSDSMFKACYEEMHSLLLVRL
jgi:hypothetical protein